MALSKHEIQEAGFKYLEELGYTRLSKGGDMTDPFGVEVEVKTTSKPLSPRLGGVGFGITSHTQLIRLIRGQPVVFVNGVERTVVKVAGNQLAAYAMEHGSHQYQIPAIPRGGIDLDLIQ